MQKKLLVVFLMPFLIVPKGSGIIRHPHKVEPPFDEDFHLFFPEKETEKESTEYQDASESYPQAVALAHQLYQAQTEKNPQRFFSILQQARQQFQSDTNAFMAFLMTRNKHGWTALMISAMTGDIVQTAAILRIVRTYFKSNPQAAFAYLNAKEPEAGYTALMFAADLGMVQGVTELVDNAAEMLKGNKQLFLEFLIESDTLKYDNPLTTLAFDSISSVMRYLVYKAEEFLGANSPEFDKFINWTDSTNFTALQYALSAEDRNFLIKHGAIIRQIETKEAEEADKLGKQLIDILHFGDLAKIKKVLYEGERKYKNNTILFVNFIAERNGGGWMPLTHAVSQGKMVYTKLIIYTIESVLKEDPTEIYNVLSSVDYAGKTILLLALQRENFDIARYIIDKVIEYMPNPYYFFNFMITQNDRNGFSPLIMTVYRSSDRAIFHNMIKFLIEKVANLFGAESRMFYLFINQLDWDRYTALDYADTPIIQELLKKYGAQMGATVFEQRNNDLARARKL